MLLPIGDQKRPEIGPAYITYAFILINLFVFFFLQGAGANEQFTYGWSVIPLEITQGVDLVSNQSVQVQGETVQVPQAPGPTPIYLTLLSAMFMHGGYLHLFGNMLYLWIFGDNVEHTFGSGSFLLFYLFCGAAGTFAQIALQPESVVPNLGASGAISGVLGAYLIFYPLNRVRVLFFYFIISLPALVVIGLWIAFQFVQGYGAIMVTEEVLGGIAYGAHIGGFVAGFLVGGLLRVVRGKEKGSGRGSRRDSWRDVERYG